LSAASGASAASQCASAGRSLRTAKHARPNRTAGAASRMNIHCQPRSPNHPSVPSSAAEMGDPRKLETGIATVNSPTIRARYSDGNQ
jgi:hypothetical protein